MATFLGKIAKRINKDFGKATANILVILPGKRASLFLKEALNTEYQNNIFCPEITSAEEFVSTITGIKIADNLELSIELYRSYQHVYGDSAETFDGFLKWSTLLLQDFNEIDRYLVDASQIFGNLKNIKEIEEWSLSQEPLTQMQKNYLEFMEKLQDIYAAFTNRLRNKKIAYQGLAYKDCIDYIADNTYLNSLDGIYICGFNALNKAEEKIFSKLVSHYKAKIIWDADEYYLKDEKQEAGQFLRKHLKKHLLQGEVELSDELVKEKKEIKIIGAPKAYSQAIANNVILQERIKADKTLKKTAVVLADESILLPVISTMPEEILNLNVTLEFPIKHSGIYDLLSQLMLLHINRIKRKKGDIFYFADLEKILHNPYINFLCKNNSSLSKLHEWIKNANKAFVGLNSIAFYLSDEKEIFNLLFTEWENAPQFLNKFIHIIKQIEEKIEFNSNHTFKLESEIVRKCLQIFKRLEEFIRQEIFENIETFKSVFNQLISEISAPFYGEPLSGLQVMGVLETRTLDFEQIILLSANENILPSGKSNNSFIPNDLKRHFHLPTYSDKDAIYAYHFFRMIQRAKKIFILYNTEPERGSSAEKSRFATQLVLELKKKNNSIEITEEFFNTGIPKIKEKTISFNSSEIVIDKLIKKSIEGFSVSYINNYKDCSLKFYLKNILSIHSGTEMEETIESTTLGQILHESLELSYRPYLNKYLNNKDYEEIYKALRKNTKEAFRSKYSDDEIKEGKNLLAFETILKYAENILREDEYQMQIENKSGSFLSIVGIEKELSASIKINIANTPTEVKFIGTFDRIEKTKHFTTITDYKSSVSSSNDKFTIDNIDVLFKETDYNKALQLLLYAWLSWKNNIAPVDEIKTVVLAMRGGEKMKYELKKEKKNLQYTEELMNKFEQKLTEFIENLFTAENNFTQTENKENCKFCEYNRFCNKSNT